MAIFSKFFTSSALLRRQYQLGNYYRALQTCTIKKWPPGPGECICVYKLAGRPGVHQIRFFRWDARPDNVFAHSRKLGLQLPMPFLMWFAIAILWAAFFDWSKIMPDDPEDTWMPHFLQFMIKVFNGSPQTSDAKKYHNEKIARPSSFAGAIYDKYGAEGIDALKESWEMVKNEDMPLEEKNFHAFMMAEAKMRYKKEIAETAAQLGLSDDPHVKQLIQSQGLALAEGQGQAQAEGQGQAEVEVAKTKAKGGMFTVQAEEAVAMYDEVLDDNEEKTVDKLGFRDRKIIEYENRIRQYSTPDKVFRYFSTYKLHDDKGNHEVMMTPEDFLRSISPGEKQPENRGLDQYQQISSDEVNNMTPLKNLDESSIFYQLGAGGLISFSDYIFLLTVLSTSRRHFEIAFKMFDLNGDGVVDTEEFEKVNTLLRSTSSTGARHRDHGNTGSTFKGINSGLITYFFGEDKTGTLTVDRFLDFQLKLQEEMLALEFKRKDPEDKGHITERDFADLLIAYAGFTTKKKQKMLRRVKKFYDPESSPGISLKDYLSFYQVLYCINDIDTALTFHTIAGAPIERSTMKHVSRTVAHVELSEHLVDVVFTLFDDNGDGMLSNKEFVSVMKQRAKRGLEKPKEIGISRVFTSLAKCAADCRPPVMGGAKKTE